MGFLEILISIEYYATKISSRDNLEAQEKQEEKGHLSWNWQREPAL